MLETNHGFILIEAVRSIFYDETESVVLVTYQDATTGKHECTVDKWAAIQKQLKALTKKMK